MSPRASGLEGDISGLNFFPLTSWETASAAPKFIRHEPVPLKTLSPNLQISKLRKKLAPLKNISIYSPLSLDVQRSRIPDPVDPHPYVNVKTM